MPTVRSILCPVDLSEPSRRALLWASAIAQHRGAELIVLSVGETLLAQAAAIRRGVDLVQAVARPALRAFVEATLPDQAGQRPQRRLEVTVGDPPDAILRMARRRGAALIVMGTHGRGGFRKLLLGSTTEQVLRRTEWPVLAVTGAAPAVEHPGVALKRLLLATDFSPSASTAVQWAADLAAGMNVPLVLAHVVEPVDVPRRWQGLAAEVDGERVADGHRRLTRLAAGFRGTTSECVVSVGPPADAIAALAVERGAGLVVMGLADAQDAESRVPGAMAYRVLRVARVPILVVPARSGCRPLVRAGAPSPATGSERCEQHYDSRTSESRPGPMRWAPLET